MKLTKEMYDGINAFIKLTIDAYPDGGKKIGGSIWPTNDDFICITFDADCVERADTLFINKRTIQLSNISILYNKCRPGTKTYDLYKDFDEKKIYNHYKIESENNKLWKVTNRYYATSYNEIVCCDAVEYHSQAEYDR